MNDDEEITSGGGGATVDKFMEYGTNGDLVVLYPQSEIVEVWDWKPLTASRSDGDTLYLLYQVELLKSPGVIRNLTILLRDENYTLLLLKQVESCFVLETHIFSSVSKTSLVLQTVEISLILYESDLKSTKFTVKQSEKFCAIGSSNGYVYIYYLDKNTLTEANEKDRLHSTQKKSLQSNKGLHKLKISEVVIQTSCNEDGIPIFDLVNGWFVYSPTKEEFKHLNAINSTKSGLPRSSEDPLITNNGCGTTSKKNLLFTPVKLPPSGPLLNKVLSTFSNIAVDGMFRLSKISSLKVQAYFKSQNHSASVDKTLNSIGKSVGKLFYSTASNTATTLQNSYVKANSNQLVKILDLSNDKVLGLTKPPGGVSAVSLSPYDLHLVHATLRGDALYMWDLYRLPLEISLLGKFRRGKTSGIIREIFWFINNFNEEQITSSNGGGTVNDNASKTNEKEKEDFKPTGNNSGFGCITKATGSIHWFNVNYLLGNLTDNFPKLFGGSKSIDSLQFLDSWILPSFNAKKFVSLPLVQDRNNLTRKANQLAVIDGKNQLKLVSTLNGRHFYKYDLPVEPVNHEFVPSNEVIDTKKFYEAIQVNPLSQAEIETCSPFLNLVNNKNISFETYIDEESNFYEKFYEFGNLIPAKPIEFHQEKKELKDSGMGSQEFIDPDVFNDLLEEGGIENRT